MISENKLYNPAGQPKEWLIEHFVVRTKVFEKIFSDILKGKMKYPEQHYLIQGQRGMGKTTLLLRLKYEIENTPDLNTWLVSVFFNEESYDLTSLSNLWEKLLKYLDEIWQTGGKYYKQTDAFLNNKDYEKLCFDLLTEILHHEKKKLIIFFDNFGQLFLDNLSEREQRRFREILMHTSDIRIIGASAVVMDSLHDYSQPFFEFFKIINLEGLNKDETFELISKLQERSEHKIDLEKSKAKIDTLAILTSGVIRTVMLIYEVILADQDGSALKDLELILDRITPLYKHRIEDLPVQQRKIIDVIAKNWDAMSTKEIAENIRENGQTMASKLISAQLQQLEKNNVIEKKKTNTKNHFYQLKERFFNIWYLMRNGDRFNRCKVIWLTRFLEIWYDDEKAMEEFVKNHVSYLKSGNYKSSSAILIADALSRTSTLDLKSQELFVRETANILKDDEIKHLPKIILNTVKDVILSLEKGNINYAINVLENLDFKNEILYTLLCFSYLKKNQNNKALSVLNNISDNNLMKCYLSGEINFYLNKDNIALNYFLKAMDFPLQIKMKRDVAYRLGIIYLSNEDYKNAVEYFLINLESGGNAFNEIAESYKELGDYENSEKYYLEGISNGQIKSKKGLVQLYLRNVEYHYKAITIIEEALIIHPFNPYYIFAKGCMLYFKDKFTEAKSEFIKSLKYSDDKRSPEYITSLAFLSYLHFEEKDKSNALSTINEINEDLPPTIMLNYIQVMIFIWNEEYTRGFKLIEPYFKKIIIEELDSDSTIENIKEMFLLLIAKGQYNKTLSLFDYEGFNLKERLKPLYYALMHFMKDEYPNEILRMGEELKQPVADVLKKIEQMAIDYA